MIYLMKLLELFNTELKYAIFKYHLYRIYQSIDFFIPFEYLKKIMTLLISRICHELVQK